MFAFLDSTEYYNRKEFANKLLQIYNENKYNFKLKERKYHQKHKDVGKIIPQIYKI